MAVPQISAPALPAPRRISPQAMLRIFLALFLSTSSFLGAEESRWEPEIKAFEEADQEKPPPENAVLFIGSSSIRGWQTLDQDFPHHPIINRGFGGSRIMDSVQFAERIILPYKPRKIVLYAGENDIAGGKTPWEVFEDFKKFVGKVPGSIPIVFISLKPSPARWHLREQFVAVNHLIEAYCGLDERLQFVDVFGPMLDQDGQPDPELFVEDNLHLNAKGYELWKTIMAPALGH
jgi:lysophospholipase L1-like esterase